MEMLRDVSCRTVFTVKCEFPMSEELGCISSHTCLPVTLLSPPIILPVVIYQVQPLRSTSNVTRFPFHVTRNLLPYTSSRIFHTRIRKYPNTSYTSRKISSVSVRQPTRKTIKNIQRAYFFTTPLISVVTC